MWALFLFLMTYDDIDRPHRNSDPTALNSNSKRRYKVGKHFRHLSESYEASIYPGAQMETFL
jgi:hypothetical protein